MRCDQFIGLPPDAIKFLHKYETPASQCPHCHRPYATNLEPCGQYEGMFGDTYYLYRHHLKSGLVAEEFLQADPWSSGPCFFLGLRISDGTEFLWPQEEIDNA